MNDTPNAPSNNHDDRRQFRRRPVLWKGHVDIAGHRMDCWIRNITVGGVLVELEFTLANGVELQIEIPNTRVLPAVVAWSSGAFHGLRFKEPAWKIVAAFGARAEKLGLSVPRAEQKPEVEPEKV